MRSPGANAFLFGAPETPQEVGPLSQRAPNVLMTKWVASVGALQFESGVRSSAANDPHRHQPSGLRRHRRHLPLCSVGYEAERTEKGAPRRKAIPGDMPMSVRKVEH